MRRAVNMAPCRRTAAPCSAAILRRRFAASSSPISTSQSLSLPSFAKQADGAALVTQGATSVLATLVANRVEPRWRREMNLIVDYREPNAGFGRIPSNATKRDGAPMIKEMQNAAVIEKCMAAAFPEEYLCETQLSISVLSQEAAHDPLVPALNAAAMAYRISPFPFKHEPWAAARCVIDESGKVNANPSRDASRGAAGSLLLAATRNRIVMTEASAAQGRTLSESMISTLLKHAMQAVQQVLLSQDALVKSLPPPHPISAKLVETNKEVMDAAALVAGDSYKQIALLPRRALFEGTQKLDQTVRAALRGRFFKLQDFETDLACESLQRSAARWAIIEAGARSDGRLPAEARPVQVDLNVLPNASHVRALLLSVGDTKVMAQHASGVARDRESDMDSQGNPKRLYVQITEPPAASTEVGRHNKAIEQHEIELAARVERILSSAITLRHPNAISRVATTLLDADGAHLPAYVMATSLALAKQGQLASAYACLEVALYEGAKGSEGAVLCDPTGLESAYADSHITLTAVPNGLTHLHVTSRAGLSAIRLPELLTHAKPALTHLSAALKAHAGQAATLNTKINKMSTV